MLPKPLPFLVLSPVDEQGNFKSVACKTITAARKTLRSMGAGCIVKRDNVRPSLDAPGTWDYTDIIVETR